MTSAVRTASGHTGRSKNSLIELAVLELDARTIRRERVRRAFDRVRDRDAELFDRLSR